jgi:hypothetical protein
MSTFWKKVLISLFGLVIISIFVGRVFEETVQEGMPFTPMVVSMANQVQNVAADTIKTIMGIKRSITAKIYAAVGVSQRGAIATAAGAQRGAIATQEAARDTTLATAAATNRQGNFVAGETGDAIQASTSTAHKTAISIQAQLLARLRELRLFFIITTILGVAILLGKYVGLVIGWFFNAIKCGFIYLSKFNSCALWYLLDIISWFIYYFYVFWFWLLDQILFIIDGIDGSSKNNPNFMQNIFVNPLMDLLDDFDCAFYEIFGFYIIHFKENVKDKCFNCPMVKFPNTPDLSNREGIRDAYNEYGAGLFGGILRA